MQKTNTSQYEKTNIICTLNNVNLSTCLKRYLVYVQKNSETSNQIFELKIHDPKHIKVGDPKWPQHDPKHIKVGTWYNNRWEWTYFSALVKFLLRNFHTRQINVVKFFVKKVKIYHFYKLSYKLKEQCDGANPKSFKQLKQKKSKYYAM